MRLSTIFLVGVLSLLVIFVAGITLAERLQAPRSPVVHFLKTVYAPTFFTIEMMGPHRKTVAKNIGSADAALAGCLLLLTPVLYSGLIVAGLALFRRTLSANKQIQPISGKPGSG